MSDQSCFFREQLILHVETSKLFIQLIFVILDQLLHLLASLGSSLTLNILNECSTRIFHLVVGLHHCIVCETTHVLYSQDVTLESLNAHTIWVKYLDTVCSCSLLAYFQQAASLDNFTV